MPYVAYLLSVDPETVVITRDNMNVLQALSNTGGMTGFMSIVLRIVVQYFAKIMFKLEVSNQVFKTDQKKKRDKKLKFKLEEANNLPKTNLSKQNDLEKQPCRKISGSLQSL